ncbi:cupin domain-containing protein [Roseixanthobacter liquoris]|uniref:cupin domain-containing protein n=1 Tax=Roseixanthobacter liquoris TaxID=3119921 RepID=UPI00372784C4
MTLLSPAALAAAAPPRVGSSIHLLGTIVTFKGIAAQTEGHYSLVEAATAPGAFTPPHVHSADAEAFYVLEGEYEVFRDGETSRHGPGSFVYMPRGTAHGFRNAGSETARMLIINVPGGLHEQFFLEAGEPAAGPLAFPPPQPPDVPKLIEVAERYGITMLPPE